MGTEQKNSIYQHCIRAIEKSLNFGDNGLPKIGSGDWNDGFSTVGNKGKGESVWLGFFQYKVLDEFSKICEHYAESLEDVVTEEISIANEMQLATNDEKNNILDNSGTEQKVIDNSENHNIGKNELTENSLKSITKQSEEKRAEKYNKIMEKLKKALNTNAWDGRWYRRAFMDDGNMLRKYTKRRM